MPGRYAGSRSIWVPTGGSPSADSLPGVAVAAPSAPKPRHPPGTLPFESDNGTKVGGRSVSMQPLCHPPQIELGEDLCTPF
jgi:hypothetical protein